MMKKYFLLLLLALLTFVNCKSKGQEAEQNNTTSSKNKIQIIPIKHATAVLKDKNMTIYIDPTGGKKAFDGYKNPDIVLITDIHGDHMNLKTLQELELSSTSLIAPKAVADKIKDIPVKELIVLNNGESKSIGDIKVEAIPMYNLREEALKFHTKGRGNGYVLTINSERIYFSGDTEDVPEMRNLKNIDRAFVCMNLPYTMTVESAASAVLEFKPKKVYPYHYRGSNGKSDVAGFKNLVTSKNNQIEVIQLKWY